MMKERIAVFAGSTMGNDWLYGKMAKELGIVMVKGSRTLVFGAGDVGLMGVISSTVLEYGGKVIGVNLDKFPTPKNAEKYGSHISVKTLSERKRLIIGECDAAIALPGGIGTLDELSEMLAMLQTEDSNKPIGILNVDGYYDSLLEFFSKMAECGFMKSKHERLIIADNDAERLLSKLDEF